MKKSQVGLAARALWRQRFERDSCELGSEAAPSTFLSSHSSLDPGERFSERRVLCSLKEYLQAHDLGVCRRGKGGRRESEKKKRIKRWGGGSTGHLIKGRRN